MPLPLMAALGIGLGGSLMGGLLGGRKSKEEKEALKSQAELNRFALETGKRDVPRAEDALSQAQQFWQQLLGDRSSQLQFMAPEVNTILSQYDTGRKTLAETAGRGGVSAARTSELPFTEAGKIAELLFGARRQAPEKIASIGQLFGALGQGGLGTAAITGQGLLDYGLKRAQMTEKLFSSIGKGLADILTGLPTRGRKGDVD